MNMTFNQMAALIKSGYTESQIKELYTIFTDPSPAPAPATPVEPTPAPAPEPTTSPAPTPAPAPTPTPTASAPRQDTDTKTAEESETVKLLREMLGLIQTNNINSIGHNGGKEEETAESILAKIL